MPSNNTASAADIENDFALLETWEERYRYIIDLGDKLTAYPEEARSAAHKVRGCVSQVWLLCEISENRQTGDDPILHFKGDSDAHIVRGLIYIIFALYSGKRASVILQTDAKPFLTRLGLQQHLTQQRSNGLYAMLNRIHAEAQKYCPAVSQAKH